MSLIQRFEAYQPSADQLQMVLPSEPRRTLRLQNNTENDLTPAIFYLSNIQNTPLEACYQLKPGCEVGAEHVAPTDPLYIRSSVADAWVAVTTGF